MTEVPESLQEAVADGFADAQLVLDGAISGAERRDGWTVPLEHTGEQGPYVMKQAVTELQQVQPITPHQRPSTSMRNATARAASWTGQAAGRTSLPFRSRRRWRTAAWSLTMYGMDEYLVANPLGRFSTRISRPGFRVGQDGSATVTMSAELPEGVPEANWLPAPEAQFMVCLRLYYPGKPVRNGEWLPPPLSRVA